MEREAAMALRGQIVRGLVVRVADGGETQAVDVETHEGIVRSSVEVLQPFGIASVPPAGALTVVLAIGGDQGDAVALPASCPSSRFGALQPGEAVLYTANGDRVHLRDGGIVEVRAGGKVRIVAPLVEIEAPQVKITGDVEITGDLAVTGDVSDAQGSMQEMRNRYNAHTHGGPGPSPIMD